MHFKKLEIFGFKSFADKTSLNFEPGITAIIGPNGCGKSNVFDAIRWVLGEQSVKELRGSAMEDVIFNGTDKKPALGFAEVSLSFSNECKTLPVDYEEVTVTRRLFRSGESEYLLNKTPVRLRDITELFMGTGIGAEAYSLVQQGKVDLIVSAKPEDRRIILDEASGITKYKSKKREALNKLKDTEQNLLRINDIIIEVKRQIASIERQAKKAQRYKEEYEKLKGQEVQLANIELEEFNEKRGGLSARLGEVRAREAKMTEEINSLNALLANESQFLEELEGKIADVKEEDIKLDGQIEVNNRQIGFNEERIETLAANVQRLEGNKGNLLERCRQQRDRIEEVKQSLAGLEVSLRKNIEDLQTKKEALEGIAATINRAKDTITREEENILEVTSKQVHVKNNLTENMKEVQGGIARKRRLDLENTKVISEKEEVDRRLEDMAQKISALVHLIEQLKRNLSEKQAVFNAHMEQLNRLQGEIDELEREKLFLNSQKDFIEKLSVQYRDIPDPVVEGRLFTFTPPAEHHSGIIGKVREVQPVNNPQLQLFPGQPIDRQLYEIICETKFIELDPQQITLKIEELRQRIQEKTALREELNASLEKQKGVIKEEELNIQEQEKKLSIFNAQQSDVQEEAGKLKEELDLLKFEIDEVSESLKSLKGKEEELSFQLDSLNQELASSQLRIKDNREMITMKLQEREETTVAIAQMETEIASADDKKKDHLENLRMFSEAMDSNLEEIKQMEEEFFNLEEKKKGYEREIETLRSAIERLKGQKDSLRGVLSENERQKEEVAQRTRSIEANISSIAAELDQIKETIHTQKMEEQEIGYKEKEIKDRLFQTYRIDLDAFNQELEAKKATAEAAAAVPVEGEAVPAEGEVAPAAESAPVNIDELRAEIEKLKKRCESFGSVNLVAIEEFEELRNRFEFLTKQQSDLITAKESLHETIRKINRQTRQMFMDTFTKVSEEFRIYYRMLFGGGEAKLILLDPENVLESGIDIIARPPGKKLQNISLLSGGEKSLTAIALIFGVFKVNPSPFCVLDEIDAALDESNVGRFAYLLKDFAKIAQFIVISHNKKTITNCDIMYGITMQETGVSKVVSVKFNDKSEEKELEAVPAGA